MKLFLALGSIAFLPSVLFGAGFAVRSEVSACISSPTIQANSVLADAPTRRRLNAAQTFDASLDLMDLCISRSTVRTAQRLDSRTTPSWRSARTDYIRPAIRPN